MATTIAHHKVKELFVNLKKMKYPSATTIIVNAPFLKDFMKTSLIARKRVTVNFNASLHVAL